jgi:hypothetical protein
VLLAVGDGGIDEGGILGLLGSRKDQGRVGGSILRLVLADGYEGLAFDHACHTCREAGHTYWQSHLDTEECQRDRFLYTIAMVANRNLPESQTTT